MTTGMIIATADEKLIEWNADAMSNMVHTVLLRATSQLLVDDGRMPKNAFEKLVDECLSSRKGRSGDEEVEEDHVPRFVGDEDEKVQRGITGAMHLFKERSYSLLLDAVTAQCDATTADVFEHAWAMMQLMVDAFYEPRPKAEIVDRVDFAARELRQALADLAAPRTVWSHIWTIHLPEYLRHWGTLYPAQEYAAVRQVS